MNFKDKDFSGFNFYVIKYIKHWKIFNSKRKKAF